MKQHIRFTIILTAFLLSGSGMQEVFAASQTSNLVRVLFLGDDGFHRPAERFQQFQPVMAKRGVELVYTDDMADVNSGKLAGFDCLAVYANTTHISQEQEKAMLEFVAAGGGFVPIHCASYCFHNSPKYIELVGAEFQRHGTGVFKETILQPDHPAMHGLSPIESWDETYIHTKHNPDRVVLAERRDAEGAEPWTWVREHGKGRVFYTAWGHDQRTWANADFHGLIENGIRWASENSPTRLIPREGLASFEYMESPDRLPNYTPNARWGTQGEPIRTMQKSLDPAESMKHFVTFPEFDISLFASEPQIVNPLWLAFDERGRLWIAESIDYPNEMQPEGRGRDRLKIVEDTDGDGRADKFTVFVEHLSIPSSFVFANDGVIVIHSGKTEFFKDTDGDDKADERRLLFDGWGTRDTHATASNLRYGFDNWIWGTVGYSGFRGTVGGKELQFGQGIFRFKPDGSALEFVRSSNNNTWGLGLTEDNFIIGSTANGNASMYMPIPNRYYEAVNGWSASRLESIADNQRIYPITDKIRQVDWHDRYTAGSGSAIYTARSFPKEYWNRGQFVAEPTGHLLGRFFLQPQGADFVAYNARNFAASDDEWASPIYAEVGPDGALWVVDWYSYIIQHNPTPIDFRTGRGNAYETSLRDKEHGRIYRMVHRGAHASVIPQLDSSKPEELVAALKNDNLLWRMHAERILVERGNRDVFPVLVKLVRDPAVDELGLNPAAIHALWTLKGLGALDGWGSVAAEAVTAALKHPSAGVRRAAVMVMPQEPGAGDVILETGVLSDVDAQTRMAALLALADIPVSDAVGSAVFAMLQQPLNSQDRWIPDAATSAAARHDVGFLRAVLTGFNPTRSESAPSKPSKLDGEVGRVVRLVTTHYAQRGPVDTIVPTLMGLKGASPAVATAVLEGLMVGWPKGTSPSLSSSDRASLQSLMGALPESVRDRLLGLSQRWNLPDLFRARMAAIVEMLGSQVKNAALDDEKRSAAAKRWVAIEDKTEVVKTILGEISLLSFPSQAAGFVNALDGSRNEDTGKVVMEHWSSFTPAVRRAAISVLMRRSEWTTALLDAVQGDVIAGTDLAPEHWSQLKQNPNRRVARRAERLSEINTDVSADREEIVKQLLPLAQKKGDPKLGREIFAANCAVCHTFNGEGGNVGPDLTGIGSRDRSEILLEVLDPNRSVEANYRLWTVATKDGSVFSGRLEAETQTTVELLDVAAQKHVIQRKDIESLEASSLSIMPVGFEALSEDDLKGLIEYLAQPPE